MYSFTEISRWLSFKLDPITLEDWIANREYLGPQGNPNDLDLELENAFAIEELRHKKLNPLNNQNLFVLISGNEYSGSTKIKDDVWLVAPSGVVGKAGSIAMEVEINGAIKDKFTLASREIKSLVLDPKSKHQVKVRMKGQLRVNKKNEIKFDLEGYRELIFDTRGRPITFDDSRTQREKMLSWKKLLK